MSQYNEQARATLRIGLAFVFLYFGYQQASDPDAWAGLIPPFLTGTILTAHNWVIGNSILEIAGGIMLALGLYTRGVALILGLHLLGITLSIGLNPVGVRDFGLTIATLVLAAHSTDAYTLDNKMATTHKITISNNY